MILPVLFFASFVGVSLKAWQQLNVMHDRAAWIIPTSYGMALCEVAGITQVITGMVTDVSTAAMVAALGTGAWMGCLASMRLHRRMRGA